MDETTGTPSAGTPAAGARAAGARPPGPTQVVHLTVVTAVPEDDWVRASMIVVGRLQDDLSELARHRSLVLPADPPPVRTRVQGGRVVAVVRADGHPDRRAVPR